MQERTTLEDQLTAIGRIERDLEDNIGMIELGEAEKHGFKVEYMEETQGEEAGLKSATIQVKGHNAYGWLKTEMGVHRLVRISPYDSNARRHT